jgi:hypothetical protein
MPSDSGDGTPCRENIAMIAAAGTARSAYL